jgi:hypothetical protein
MHDMHDKTSYWDVCHQWSLPRLPYGYSVIKVLHVCAYTIMLVVWWQQPKAQIQAMCRVVIRLVPSKLAWDLPTEGQVHFVQPVREYLLVGAKDVALF